MGGVHLLAVCVVALAAVSTFTSAAPRTYHLRMEDLDQLLTDGNYDRLYPPSEESTKVKIGMYAISIELDIGKSTMEIEVYLRQSWTDPRLQNSVIPDDQKARVPDGTWDKIWLPDTFYRNALDVSVFPSPHSHRYMTMANDGSVWYVQRLKLSVYCPGMKVRDDGPGSSFYCALMFESFSYTKDRLAYDFLPEPYQMDPNVYLEHFELIGKELRDCSQNYTAGAFPCLEISSRFRHTLAPRHMFGSGIYAGSFFLVLISWVPLWFEADMLVKRLGLGLAIVFVLVLQLVGVALYEKGYGRLRLLTWLVTGLMFALAVILETIFAHVLLGIAPITFKRIKAGKDETPQKPKKPNKTGRKLDLLFAMLVFPLSYMIFVIIFWSSAKTFDY